MCCEGIFLMTPTVWSASRVVVWGALPADPCEKGYLRCKQISSFLVRHMTKQSFFFSGMSSPACWV